MTLGPGALERRELEKELLVIVHKYIRRRTYAKRKIETAEAEYRGDHKAVDAEDDETTRKIRGRSQAGEVRGRRA